MDIEQTIAGIEWLERIFLLPDTRPLSASDLAVANRRHDRHKSPARGFASGSDTECVAQNGYSGIAASAMSFSIPESSKPRIPRFNVC
jgi:hypothetical protein